MAVYAIGDIQGCYDSFRHLLEVCHFDEGKDQLWLVGDLVNRGPRSLETLRYVKSLQKSAVVVLGNHDLTLLIVAEGIRKPGRGDTFDEILNAHDAEELINWLRFRPMFHYTPSFCMVHAGLLPQWSVMQAKKLAEEVEYALRRENWQEFLKNMWGNTPDSWNDSLTSWERLRVIINGMTRLRFCTEDGVMDFDTKGELLDAPAGFLPWFDVHNRQSRGVPLVTGHWSALGLKTQDDLLSLDSGCLWGGKLTAVRLEDRAVFQVDCARDEISSWAV